MNLPTIFFALCFLTSFMVVQADDALARPKHPPIASSGGSSFDDKDWTIELGSGVLLSDVRTDIKGYTLVPVDITASLKLDDVSLDDTWVRGNSEFFFRGFGIAVVHGLEDRFVGMNLGPRYNFVQRDWPVVPFIEGFVGFSFTNARGLTTVDRGDIGQGQDFTFNFGIAGGVRYDINDEWFMRLSGFYSHFSNAGLSEPGRNNHALDAAGPELSLGYRF
ncbi:MAG: acyloxyacyl hydrolase [Verrucomicrobia bacterium]|nr:acyloxyacyl hydrolase [Verrucomicrobiota bacterium]